MYKTPIFYLEKEINGLILDLIQLVALIILLIKFAENQDVETSSPLRILVSGQTNVAVDNILQVSISITSLE